MVDRHRLATRISRTGTSVILSAGCVLPFALVVVPLARDAPVGPGPFTAGFIVLSATANLGVLTYHYLTPPHPKFQCEPWRRRLFRLHIFAGTVELIAGLSAFALGGHPIAGYIASVAALALHVPSSLLLTPAVFGARAVMWPGYLICIVLHAFTAGMLWMNPASMYWTAATFLVLNVYAWVRVCFTLFTIMGLFPNSRYSAAILVAEVIVLPMVFGPAVPFLLMLSCLIYVTGYRLLFSREDFQDLVRERAIEGVYLDGVEYLWGGLGEKYAPSAQAVFDELSGGNDRLHAAGLLRLLRSVNVPDQAVSSFVQQLCGEHQSLCFEQFNEHFWSVRQFRSAIRRKMFSSIHRTDREKAEFVFRLLDLDANDQLADLEMQQLLAAWGLRQKTALEDFHRGVDLDTFIDRYEYIWRFLYHEVLDQRSDSGLSHMQRVAQSLLERLSSWHLLHKLRQLRSQNPECTAVSIPIRDVLMSSVLARRIDSRRLVDSVWMAFGEPIETSSGRVASGEAMPCEAARELSDTKNQGWFARFAKADWERLTERNGGVEP